MSKRTSEVANISLSNAQACFAQGNFGRSFANYLLYLKLAPEKRESVLNDFVLVMREWTEKLERESRTRDLFKSYEQACEIIPDCETIMNNIGAQLFRMGYIEEAAMYIRRSVQINPDYIAAKENLDNICSHLVERWHFRMLNDLRRNSAFSHALQQAVHLGHNSVLDLGAGTGILSMFSKRAGAKVIYACERSQTMCDLMSEILTENNCQDISLIHKDSMDLRIPEDLPGQVDLLVTETFDAGLFGEHIIPSLVHAWNNLLCQSRGKVLPERATVYVSALECEKFRLSNRFIYPGLQDLDFDGINIFCSTGHSSDDPYTTENLSRLTGSFRLLSDPMILTTVNFNNIKKLEDLLQGVDFDAELVIKKHGKLDGFVVWFDLHLINDISLTTSPVVDNCWEQAIFPVLPSHDRCPGEMPAVLLKENDIVSVSFNLQESRLHLNWWQKDNKMHLTLPHDSQEMADMSSTCYLDRRDIYHLNNLHLDRIICKSLLRLKQQHPNQIVSLLDFSTHFSPISLQLCQHGYKTGTVIMRTENHTLYKHLKCSNKLNEDSDFVLVDPSDMRSVTTRHDVIICDLVESCGALRQQVLEDIDLLKLSCLATGGYIMPGKMWIHGVCIESEQLLCDSAVIGNDRTLGLHIAKFINQFQVSTHLDIDFGHLNHVKLTDPFQLFFVDFNEKTDINKPSNFLETSSNITVIATDTGHLTAVVYWFEFELYDGIKISTLESVLPWNQAAMMIKPSDIDLVCGEQIQIQASLKNSCVNINVSQRTENE